MVISPNFMVLILLSNEYFSPDSTGSPDLYIQLLIPSYLYLSVNRHPKLNISKAVHSIPFPVPGLATPSFRFHLRIFSLLVNALLHMPCSLIYFDHPILCLLPLEYKLHGGRAFRHYFLDASQMIRAHLAHDRRSKAFVEWMNELHDL